WERVGPSRPRGPAGARVERRGPSRGDRAYAPILIASPDCRPPINEAVYTCEPAPSRLREMSTIGFNFRTLLAACVSLGLTACNFEVPSSSYLTDTKLISVIVEVVELGPLNPGRVGVPSEAPIAEPMPHDRVAFDAVVVDADGKRLPADELETIWFQCGVVECDY